MDNDEYLSSKFNELLEKQKSKNKNTTTTTTTEPREEIDLNEEEEAVWEFITSTAKNGKSKMPKTTSSTSKNGWEEEIQRCEEQGGDCDFGRTEEETGHHGQKVGNGTKTASSANGRKTSGKKTPPAGRKSASEKKKQQSIKSNRSTPAKPKPITNIKTTNVPQSTKASIRNTSNVAIQNKRNGEGLSFFHCQVTVNMI